MSSAVQEKIIEAKDSLLNLFDRLVLPMPGNGDSPVVADVASAIIPKILSSEDCSKLQALKDKVQEYVRENSEFLSKALQESMDQIFIACIERLCALCKSVKSVTSSANLDKQKAMDFQFHPRNDSGAEEEEEHGGSWVEVSVPT